MAIGSGPKAGRELSMDQSRTNKIKWSALAIGGLLLLGVIAWTLMGRVQPDALGVGLIRTSNRSGSTVAYIAVTNLGSRPVEVAAVSYSNWKSSGWRVDVSTQYPPLAPHASLTVKIGVDDTGDAWKVRVSSAPAPGELRNACLLFFVRYKMTFAFRLLAPRFSESAVINGPARL
jgi:hypothetical protein